VNTFRTLCTIRVDGKRTGEDIRITVERNIVDAKQFLMQTSHREKNVLCLRAVRGEPVDRSFLAEQTFDDRYVCERTRAYIRTRKNTLYAYLRCKLCSLRYSKLEPIIGSATLRFCTNISIFLGIRYKTLDKRVIY